MIMSRGLRELQEPVVLKVTTAEQKEQLNELLAYGFLKVIFTKKSDGSERTMVGTKMKGYIPEQKLGTSAPTPRKENEFIINLFDTDLQEWRSFSLENLKFVWKYASESSWLKRDNRLYEEENQRLRDMTDGPGAV